MTIRVRARFGRPARGAILKALVEHDRNVLETARDLGISRATIYRRLRRYGIDPVHRCSAE